MSNIVFETLGDLHPLAVHFPIGIFGLIAFILLLSKLKKIEIPLPFFRLINLVCLLSLIVSILLGLVSENTRSYSGNDAILVEWHEQLGFLTFALFSIACLLLFFSDKSKNFFKWYLIMFIFSFLALSIGGHLGSTIVHGEITIIKHLNPPPPTTISAKKITKSNNENTGSKIDFNTKIRPIFEENCFKCHGEKKQKGDLRLDTNDFHKVIEPFKPEKSKLVELISLPPDNEDIMPPKDGPLPKELIDLINEWVKQGATISPSKDIKE